MKLCCCCSSSSWCGNMREKCSKSNKKGASVAHYGIDLPCLPCMAFLDLYGLMWPRMALMLLFTAMAVCGLIRISMALYGLVWLSLAFSGILWQNIAFSRGHRSKFIWSCSLGKRFLFKEKIDNSYIN